MNLQLKRKRNLRRWACLQTGGWTELCGPEATSGVPGKHAKGEFQAWLGHQGELGLGREKEAMGLQGKPPSQQGGGGEGQASMVPSVFQNVLKDEAQRVLGRHKIWTC